MSGDQDGLDVEPEDELLMHSYETLPDECKKYWKKRYSLFSKFDDGIYMTLELWYLVTPESVAAFIAILAQQLIDMDTKRDPNKPVVVVDVCCGAGGNTIQLAEKFDHVIAIDINKQNLYCTMHNAAIYGVEDKIKPVLGDWNELIKNPKEWLPEGVDKVDFMFSSPPWGGPSYKHTQKPESKKKEKKGNNVKPPFDLNTMSPLNLETLVSSFKSISDNFLLFLPRTSNLYQLSEVTEKYYGSPGLCKVTYMKELGFRIALAALFGEYAQQNYQYLHSVMPFDDYCDEL